jgi:cytochrome bd ubiquinol oxidase subunit II
MSLPALLAIILGVSLTAYAVLAGADFGAGILDLRSDAGPDRPRDSRGSSDRDAIAASIGPLWEANHVWLIFSITILFSAFPRAFSAIGTGLLAPFTVALLAIVVRSVALGLRGSAGTSARSHRRLSTVFGLASVVAPFALGTIAGGLAQAAVTAPPPGAQAPGIPWTGPFALAVGALAVATCAQLAAGFVTLRCARSAQRAAAERFRGRALASGGAVLVVMAIALVVAAAGAPSLWHRLTGAALPLVVAAVAAEVLAVLALARRRYLMARAAGVVSAGTVLWGWFVAQAPRLVGPRLTVHTAAATHPALVAVAVSVGAVLVAVVPATVLLFRLFDRPVLEVSE